jgi:hypothetical protein
MHLMMPWQGPVAPRRVIAAGSYIAFRFLDCRLLAVMSELTSTAVRKLYSSFFWGAKRFRMARFLFSTPGLNRKPAHAPVARTLLPPYL